MKVTKEQFPQLVETYKSTIYGVCYMFSKDNDEVADLFQEVLINLWLGLDSFSYRDDGSLKAWIYRVTMNTCLMLDREKKRHGEVVPLSMETDLFDDTPADNEQRQQIQALYDRIQLLAPVDRAIVLMWLTDMSYEEIARIIGISVQNVSVKLVRIREKLKKMQNP